MPLPVSGIATVIRSGLKRLAGAGARVRIATALALLAGAAAWLSGGPAATPPARPVAAVPPEPFAVTAAFAPRVLNVLLVPLIDDGEPPAWTDAALHLVCDAGTRVQVDGAPLRTGAPLPATSFHVRWQIDRCWPFSDASVELSGTVDLQVFHDDDGLGAVVDASRLHIAAAAGSGRIAAPFAATIALGGASAGPAP